MKFSNLEDWLKWQQTLHTKPIDLGLERVRTVYERLKLDWGHTKCISVAGTNGKGSTIAFLRAIYCSAGYKVAQFTSPHFIDYNERFQFSCAVNNKVTHQTASDEQIMQAFEQIDSARCSEPEITLSYFEFSTLAACILICNEKPDVALLEVGLGGRLDATNLIDADCAIVTSISIDHQEWLGNTREAIGFEKAGIYRAGVPAICGDTQTPVSVKEHAQNIGALWLGRNEQFHVKDEGADWSIQCGERIYHLPRPNLVAPIQVNNAACAVMAVHSLQSVRPVSDEALAMGLTSAQVAGRMQVIEYQGVTVILDVAHNEASAQAVVSAIAKEYPQYAVHLAIGMLADKEVEKTVSILEQMPINSVFTTTLNSERTLSGSDMAKCFGDQYAPSVCANVAEAINGAVQQAISHNDSSHSLVLAVGSFFMIKDVMLALGVPPVISGI